MSGSAEEKFKLLLTEVNKFLSRNHFSKKGNSFFKSAEGNWGIINFQKSQSSGSSSQEFTINLGVFSMTLWAFYNQEVLLKKPNIEDCHWRKRIGFVLPDEIDRWWKIEDKTPFADLSNEIEVCVIRYGIPEIDKHISDDGLKKLWLSGRSDGLTDLQRLMNLSVLLKASSSESDLVKVLEELVRTSNGKPFSSTVKYHIESLNKY